MKKILFLMAALITLACSKDDEGGVKPPVEPPVAEVPVAVDDELSASENTSLKFSGLLDNDTVFEYARITEIDSQTTEGGTVVDNRDGTYTYTPPRDFMGEDTFEYTMCDNASPKNCSTATVTVTVTASSVVAVDDAYETGEDKVLTITNHLDNDDVPDNAAVSSVDVEATVGTVEIQSDGNITYTPAESFVGEDSFTYTICNDHETPICSTATITITVVDEGSPLASDDSVAVESGTTLQISVSDLLANDDLLDDAVLTSIDDASTQGTVVLNQDGTITYTPASGVTGEDQFSYTICDDDDTPTCSIATVSIAVVETVAFNIPADIQGYYENTVFTTDKTLLISELYDVSEEQHVNRLEYYTRHDYLYDADADLTDPNYVILMYTGDLRLSDEYQQGDVSEGETFNTEHIFPQSKLASDEAKNDMHHMRVADIGINSLRLNHPFTTGSGDAKLVGDDQWYPGDDWKGDVARMVMYVHVRYGEPFSDVGNREMFLKWNLEDPVSEFEMQRQEVIEGAQGNRNPFIDNPYLATLIWGGTPAENLWQ